MHAGNRMVAIRRFPMRGKWFQARNSRQHLRHADRRHTFRRLCATWAAIDHPTRHTPEVRGDDDMLIGRAEWAEAAMIDRAIERHRRRSGGTGKMQWPGIDPQNRSATAIQRR